MNLSLNSTNIEKFENKKSLIKKESVEEEHRISQRRDRDRDREVERGEASDQYNKLNHRDINRSGTLPIFKFISRKMLFITFFSIS